MADGSGIRILASSTFIGIRETGFRNIDGSPTMENGALVPIYGRGIFQIDIKKHPEVSEAMARDIHLATYFALNLQRSNYSAWVENNFDFDGTQFRRALAASYNFGIGNISGNPTTIDIGTTKNNYGSNILDLMDCSK